MAKAKTKRRWRSRQPSQPVAPLVDIAHPTYRSVHPWAFPRLDRRFYEDSKEALEGLGFDHLGNVENVAANKDAPRRCRTFISALLSTSGETMAGIYQLRAPLLRFLGRRLRGRSAGAGRIVDLCSRLGDGTYLVTSNTRGLFPSSADIEGVHQQHYATDTPVRELVAVHHYELRALVRAQDSAPQRLESLEALLGAQAELERRREGDTVGDDRRSLHSVPDR